MKEGTQYRIGIAASVVLVIIALIFDLLSLIPLLGTIFAPILWFGVGVYFWTKGVGMFSGKKLATSAISMIAEMFPIVQSLPLLTAGVVVVIIMIRIEDKTGFSVVNPKKGIAPPRNARTPMYQNGIRAPRRGNIESNANPRNTQDEEISLAE